MYAVTTQYLAAVRSGFRRRVRLDHRNLATGVVTPLAYGSQEADDHVGPWVTDGTVTVDATSIVRRSLSVTLPGSQTMWDVLDTVGGEITVALGVDYRDGTAVEWVPQGVFTVDVDNIDYAGSITVSSAPDRWGKIQKNKMPPAGRSSVPTNAAWQEIKRLVEGAWSTSYPFPGWAALDTSASTKVGALVWDDGDREAAILSLCADNAVEVFFDRSGQAVLQPVPQLTDASTSIYTVDAGDDGILLSANRTRDRTRAYNAIILTTSATDVTFLPVEVKNTTAGDPLSVNGPLGYQAVEYSSASLRNSAQARAAGKAMLGRATGVAKQLSLTSAQCDALDASDVIDVILPQIDRNTPRPTEQHIIDTLVVPFTPAGVMEIQTRSTVPATLGS